jgi:TPR repeat protein
VDKALRRGLAKDPVNRYDSCSELVSALDAALRPAPRKPPSRRIYYLFGSGAVAAILLAGLMIYRPRMPNLPPAPVQAALPAVPPVSAPNAGDAAAASVPKPAPVDHTQLGTQLYAEALAERNAGQAKAATLLEEAAKSGNVNAMVKLGEILQEGERPDFARAAVWLRRAADKGNTDGMVKLGVLYQLGNGVPEDSSRAVYWYERAAQGGNAAAIYNLSNLYAVGSGVPLNPAKAKELLRSAAALGNTSAKRSLAQLEAGGK